VIWKEVALHVRDCMGLLKENKKENKGGIGSVFM
jgi:hypothetical protein